MDALDVRVGCGSIDPTSTIGSLFAAFGLSGAAGLNAWIPLLGLALVGRLGWIDLGDSYEFLERTPALVVIATCLVVDFVGDKVPAVDHLLHAAGAVIHPAAGAVLFAAQTGVAGDLDPTLALALGAVVSGSVHAERAVIRPLSTAGTGGIGNPVLSLAEDTGSVTLTLAAFLLPLLALVLVIAMLAAGVVAWRALRRRRARTSGAPRARP